MSTIWDFKPEWVNKTLDRVYFIGYSLSKPTGHIEHYFLLVPRFFEKTGHREKKILHIPERFT